jgi:hypothetical protein
MDDPEKGGRLVTEYDEYEQPMSSADVEQRLYELRQRLAAPALRSPEDLPVPPVAGVGEAGDGWVKLTASAGRLVSGELNPRTRRMNPEELGGWLRDAANAALEASTRLQGVGAGETLIDPAVLSERLTEVRNEGLRQMESITQGLHDAMGAVRRRVVVRSDAPGSGLEQLLDMAVGELESLRSRGGVPAAAHTSATSADGLVRVVAVTTTRLAAISLDERALRKGSYELVELVVRTSNAAIDKLRDHMVERLREADEGRRDRMRELQDLSLAQMRTFTASLQDMMHSVEPPEGEE